MIRKSLTRTKSATFSILLPNPKQKGLPTPIGTGFFVSADGWFVTAAHVLTENGKSDGPVRSDIAQSYLMKEPAYASHPGAMCQHISFELVNPRLDFGLLKVDFQKNADKAWLKDLNEFPFVEISARDLDEGEPVYSFGYPLSDSFVLKNGGNKGISIGTTALSPRVTSAIVSSKIEETRMVITSGDPKIYVLDKALNYGNSGGPIVSTETGKVHAFCSRFQPVFIPQNHLSDAKGNPLAIISPSLYGIVTSLANPELQEHLTERGVQVSSS
jgi:hypothetical protein